jgi:DNA-binding response OmpR family regulator
MLSIFKSKKKTRHTKILIVDDEPGLVETMQCRLEFCKYEVSTAINGKEGLEKAANERPDLILLDTNMPILNGHQMLERLRNNPDLKDIPVIICTALCEAQDIATASSYGIADYITKPFDYAQLMDKISNVLGN